MKYTCKVCSTTQARTFSKDSYTKGVVLVRCEGCDNLHLVADNLGWFEDGATNVETILKEQGNKITKYDSQEVLEFTEK